MSIFPTKILLATDGSKEARQAADAAAELSKDTGSEVHIVYVLPSPRELRGHHLYSTEVMRSVLEQAEGEARSSRSRPSRWGRQGGRLPRLTSRRESQKRRL
jgi:nucleotide-binding universal stress UspA family protein